MELVLLSLHVNMERRRRWRWQQPYCQKTLAKRETKRREMKISLADVIIITMNEFYIVNFYTICFVIIILIELELRALYSILCRWPLLALCACLAIKNRAPFFSHSPASCADGLWLKPEKWKKKWRRKISCSARLKKCSWKTFLIMH